MSFWIVPLGGVIFAAASVIERRALWQYALSSLSFAEVARQLLMTVLTQMGVVAIVYLLLFGLAAIVTGHAGFAEFGRHAAIVLALTAAFLWVAAVLKARLGADWTADDALTILEEIEALASSPIVMPATIFRLASQIAKQKRGFAVSLIKQCVAYDESFHVRRIAFAAIRLMGLCDNPLLDVRAFLDRGFADPHPWVRHDAVFAADALGFDDEALRTRLAEIAGGIESPADDCPLPSSDALLHSRVKAARLLKRLEGPVAA
jgi:hypothetical protein